MKIILYNKVRNFALGENFFTIDAYHTSGVSRAKIYSSGKRPIFNLPWWISRLRAAGLTDCFQRNPGEIYFVLLN